ncbi:MAG: hypothetical protein HYY04_08060, partial [Chloroflexi bacterium]|nr:hypothetical protein [Chloroflexota bacterium]
MAESDRRDAPHFRKAEPAGRYPRLPPIGISHQWPLAFLAVLLASLLVPLFQSRPSLPVVFADPYPPVWGTPPPGTPTASHYLPAPWPSTWTPYTHLGADIKDPRVQDPSNGGTSPQNYVNISSGCTDQSLPSLYYAYD